MADADGPPPTPAAHLAALAHAFNGTRPRLIEETHSRLIDGPVAPPRPGDLGRALAPLFAREFVQRSQEVEWRDDIGERRTVAKLRADDPTAADHRAAEDFADLVARVLCRLPEPGPAASSGLRAGVRHARRLAEHGTRSPWVRAVARAIVAELPAMAEVGVTLYRDGEPERGSAWTPERRREYDRARRGPSREGLTTAACWVLDWRDHAEPAAYKTAEVHEHYRSEVAEPEQLSRTQFHRIASHPTALGPPVRRASGRHYVVQEAAEMTREERRDLALLIVAKLADEFRDDVKRAFTELREEREAAVTTPAPSLAGNVVSLAERRARRAA
ncbi:hypothetical protein ACQPYA_01020 [Micromonospora sp. CA-263727]|uniref:hypothetical protein n=1 Tax=Micromonospora sp. CA-263727 TaxID=3239967 RepID=UPI003D8F304B